MHNIYNLVAGPLAWAAFIAFFGGLIGRFIYIIVQARRKDRMVFTYFSLKYMLRSWIVWSTPYATRNMRLNPIMTAVAFLFHICLIVAPIFLTAHVIMLDDFMGVSWATLPAGLADIMTVIVVLACVYFAVRRIVVPEARYVTNVWDYVLLAVVASPFLTGFLAYHQIFNYQFMIILHILLGEIWLAIIPFTRLSHMILGPLVRGYMGSEFGGVRHVKDW